MKNSRSKPEEQKEFSRRARREEKGIFLVNQNLFFASLCSPWTP